ncbi:MAG: DNA alkylation repair protein, partial [Eubacteriaceae bacterium]|nr:DNA alkylation repair protein [Eubacteriaceae bacterium]
MAKGHDNITHEIRELLRQRSDPDYRDFQAKLIPNVDPSGMIGVRTPELRALARELSKREDIGGFLADTPHRFFDEDQLHAFIISLTKDFETCLAQVEAFLPFIGNWATCDQLSPKVFGKKPEKLLPYIRTWIRSEQPYTVRFAIGMLMQHFLGV